MKPYTALHLQMRLEGLIVDDGLLSLLPAAPEECPLVLLAQLVTGETLLYMHHALPQSIHADLEQWRKTASFAERAALLDIFLKRGFAVEQGHYKTYWAPSTSPQMSRAIVGCYAKDDPRIAAFGFSSFADRVYAVSVDGQIVSACVSVRENDQCAEAWVATAPAYQQRGYAQLVVCAWARQVLAEGKVPFYSHRLDNAASAGLARRVGCVPLFEEITISPSPHSPPT